MDSLPGGNTPAALAHPTFGEALRFWAKLGFISFGGPAGQIAIMHAELVERRRWIGERRFLHALNYCMLLPGPEAQQLAIYLGWLLHRTWGGIAAGVLFVLPSAVILWLLSFLYVAYGEVRWLNAAFDGLKPAILAIVTTAALRLGRKTLKNPVLWTVAALAFGGIFFLHLPFPLIVLGAGLIGLIGGRVQPDRFAVVESPGAEDTGATVLDDRAMAAPHTRPSLVRALKVGAVGLLLWWLPVLLLGAGLGWQHTVVRQGLFFSKAALVTFGGAYAVLPYVSQQAVEHYGWLTPGQMLDGLGLAETTPGPLIMVLQFVGFLGGWKFPAPFPPLVTATLGAAVTTWTTFVPCFLWIFLGAPHIEQLRGNVRLSATLAAITAAVVGVILNLAVWFGQQVLFPDHRPANLFGLATALLVLVGLTRWKWGIIPAILAAAALGVLKSFF